MPRPSLIAASALRLDATDETSLRRTLIQRTGASTSMRVTRQRRPGFHRIASKTERAADGVMTS